MLEKLISINLKLIAKLLLACLIISIPAFGLAQSPTHKKNHFGLNFGLGANKLESPIRGGSQDYIIGFSGGILFERRVSHNILLGGQLNFTQRGSTSKSRFSTIKINYLELPIYGIWRIGEYKKVKPILTGGGYFAYKVNSKGSGGYQFTLPLEGIKNYDFGIKVGAGVLIFDFIQISANYGVGLEKEVAFNFVSSTSAPKSFGMHHSFFELKLGIITNFF